MTPLRPAGGAATQPPASAAGIPGARNDPVANAVPGQELVYGAIQSLWSAWARRRYRDEFDRVSAFCLFMGYPRSGHSVIGAALNAHRHAVVSHELDAPRLVLAGSTRDELYSRILARAAWFNLRGNRSNYRYQVPNPWQGRFEALHVVGDKGGGWAAQWLGRHPDLLKRLRETTGVPLRLIHVVRNPFDNIAAISRWHRLSLDESIAFYFSHCETTGRLEEVGNAEGTRLTTIHHEDFIRAPVAVLSSLCDFLSLEPDAEYLAACGSIVFDRPTNSRQRVEWSAAQVAAIERRMRNYAFLAGYAFEVADEPRPDGSVPAAPVPPRPGAGTNGRNTILERLAAFLSPRVRPPAAGRG